MNEAGSLLGRRERATEAAHRWLVRHTRCVPGELRRRDLGVAGSSGFIATAGTLVLAGGGILALIRMVGASPAESLAEQVGGGLSLGALIAAPGALALLALRERPALLLPAAVALMPLSFLSFAGLTLPLLVPAVMLAVAYGRRSAALAAAGRTDGRPLLATVAVLGLLIAAGAALLLHADPRSYSTPTGGGFTSDVITPAEAALSLSLVLAALAAGWVLAKPGDGDGLDRSRRSLFSKSAETYDARPGYPERVFDLLAERCGLGPGVDVVEIGPGTGQATHPLLDRGASVVAVELGAEFAELLRERFEGRRLRVEVGAFEDIAPALLAQGLSVDLVVAATSFHWVPTGPGLTSAADLLRPGGWLALWWNSFGDPDRPDPFHDALEPLLAELAPSLLTIPSAACVRSPLNPSVPHATDAAARIADIDATGRFGPVHHETIAWTGRHTAVELRQMFASFSPWLALPDDQRTAVLDAVERLATEEFDGVVERPYLTPMYLAQRW